MEKALPYKIVDSSGQNRYGVVVTSLHGLIKKAHEKFGASPGMKIVLESDGTEVDEEEYFSTLEQNTCFMILKENEDWVPPSQYNYLKKYNNKDEVDYSNNQDLVHLLERIRNDAGQLSMLGGKELELLSDMDPESLSDIIQDKEWLVEVKEASSRYNEDRRDAKEALKLLKIYHQATNSMIQRGYANVTSTGTSANEAVQ
ncbi:DNA fragmentation factor subunit alpha-like [Planococcus citri]|uniref:DNA fragmentation factor subunit alpha-like n=1 Tax=Planococcus citri TaxID=170843 RepID=UPI0031F97344